MGNALHRCTIAACLVLGACSGSGEGLDENGRPLSEGGGSGPVEPTIESIQDNVFTPRCTTCHQGIHPSGLTLENAQQSYDNLVDVASTENATIDRVEPGQPDNSYLIHKLEGRPEAGTRMPLNQPPLSQETIDVIQQWIAEGAAPPGSSMQAQSLFLPATDE